MINLQNIFFKYKQNLPYVLKNINVRIDEKEKVLIAGMNGAGKTTFSKIISGILPKIENGMLEGEYFLYGRDTKTEKPKDLLDKIGILLQDFESQLVTSTVKEELVFYPLNKAVPYKRAFNYAKMLLERFGILNLFERDITELSGGEKQKIALLALLSSDPEIVILDEPFTDLDPLSRDEVLTFLNSEFQDKTVLLFEQSLNYFEFFTRIIVLQNGEIIYDGDDPFSKRELIEKAGMLIPFIRKIFPACDVNNADIYVKENFYFDENEYQKLIKDEKKEKETIISVTNLKYRYEGYDSYALDDITFDVKKEDFIVVAGSNGSGKTTLMKILSGIIPVKNGQIKKNMHNLKISYVYQNPDNQIFAETVFDEVSFILKTAKEKPDIIKSRTEKMLKDMGLFEKKDEDPFNLPKGDRQKVACASILVGEPDVLIMDEPTTGLDYPSLKGLMNILQELNDRGKTILMITHDMDVAADYGNKMLILDNGKTSYYGNKRGLFNDDNLIRKANLKRTEVMDLSLRLNGNILLNESEFYACWRKK
ncbi:MAG: ABC transporter ATP-binding protein [Candidatus Goldbacteria bacterium]|nr:ABC transporter ATP-binding protein [Candidatus Goldiibacteriota bacterium]